VLPGTNSGSIVRRRRPLEGLNGAYTPQHWLHSSGRAKRRGIRISMERTFIERLLTITSGQLGLVSIDQAAAVGVTLPMLRAAADRGWLHHQRHGIYVAAGVGPSRWRPVVAAALAAGSDAVVSHTTAAAAHHFYGIETDEIDLTIPLNSRRSLQGVRIHRSTLPPEDVQHRYQVQLTTPVRTLIDISGGIHAPLLGRIIDEGAIARLWTAELIMSRIDGHRRGVKGVAELRPLLALRVGEGNPDSKLEQRVVRAVKGVAPGYTLHHQVVLDGEVITMDIAWVDEKIDGEADGMLVRAASRTKFERSCRRDNILAAHGWRIVHFTAEMDDKTLVAQIAPLLRGSA
jgi:very-short-patch-repair endonuclease